MAPLSLGWKQQLLHSGEKLHEVQTIAVDLYFSLAISKSTLRKLSKLILNRQSELESNFLSSTAEKQQLFFQLCPQERYTIT